MREGPCGRFYRDLRGHTETRSRARGHHALRLQDPVGWKSVFQADLRDPREERCPKADALEALRAFKDCRGSTAFFLNNGQCSPHTKRSPSLLLQTSTGTSATGGSVPGNMREMTVSSHSALGASLQEGPGQEEGSCFSPALTQRPCGCFIAVEPDTSCHPGWKMHCRSKHWKFQNMSSSGVRGGMEESHS